MIKKISETFSQIISNVMRYALREILQESYRRVA
jgi:hypothetical protein